jgi:hypothetical protein
VPFGVCLYRYYFGFYTPDGTEIQTISHQVGGPPASAQNFVAATTSFDSADHPEAIGQPLVIRLGKDQDGQAHYHDIVVQSRPTATATGAASFCSAQTTSAGFCGATGTTRPVQVGDTTQGGTTPVGGADSHCVNPGNTGNMGGGTNGYGQGTGQPLTPGESVTMHLQVCVDHQDDIYFQDNRIWFQYGGHGDPRRLPCRDARRRGRRRYTARHFRPFGLHDWHIVSTRPGRTTGFCHAYWLRGDADDRRKER